MIPLVKEDPEMFDNLGVYEHCYFCLTSTDMWHKRTNNPVCPECAKRHKVSELPDFGRILRNRERREKRKKSVSK